MRILTVVALLILAFTSASKAANDEPLVLSRPRRPLFFFFFFFFFGVLGGVCERNHGATPETPKKSKPKTRSR